MNIEDIKRVKSQYDDPFGKLAIEICEQDPMFWGQDERGCRSDLEYWVKRIMDLIK